MLNLRLIHVYKLVSVQKNVIIFASLDHCLTEIVVLCVKESILSATECTCVHVHDCCIFYLVTCP
jgi:hypothetical protein